MNKAIQNIYRYSGICSSPDDQRLDDLHQMAKTMGVKHPEIWSKNALCNDLDHRAKSIMERPLPCTNLKGINLYGDNLKDVPPYLIYTFKLDKIDDDDGRPVQNATICADIRDLIRYLDTTRLRQDSDDDELLRLGQYGTNRPVLFSHPSIKLPHSVRQDIRRRWDLLTNFGKNPVDSDEDIVPVVPSVKQRVTDLFTQMGGYPAISIADFAESDPSTLVGYLESASHYYIMDIAVEDVDEFKREPTITKFIDLILRKADQSEHRNTFMVALTGIINGEDLGDIRIPTPVPSSDDHDPIIVRELCTKFMEGLNALSDHYDHHTVNDVEFERALNELSSIFTRMLYQIAIRSQYRLQSAFDELVADTLHSMVLSSDYEFIRFLLKKRISLHNMSFMTLMLEALEPPGFDAESDSMQNILTTLWNLDPESRKSKEYILDTIIPGIRDYWTFATDTTILNETVLPSMASDYKFIISSLDHGHDFKNYISNIAFSKFQFSNEDSFLTFA